MKYTIELTQKQKKQMDLMCELFHRYVGFNPKLEMDIPIPMKESPAYKKGFEDGNKIADKDLKEIQDTTYVATYSKALKDTDHAMDVLKSMTGDECAEWFEDCVGVDEVVCGFTVQRIVEITQSYVEKKKAEEIKVGDILHEIDTNNNHIIVGIYDGHYETIVFNGTDFDSAQINRDYTLKTDYEKLDKNVFNEVSQLLHKLRGEKDEKN